MTGLNQPPDLTGSRHAPFRFVFQKPVNFVELSHCLRKFLDPANGRPKPSSAKKHHRA
jgi:hypothetical protein